MSDFKINDVIEISGLIKNTNLNGKTGKIITNLQNGRYGIIIDNLSKGKLIKIKNIKPFKINIYMNITKKMYWCLHPDCLTSLECFQRQSDLDKHMKLH